MSTSTHQEQCVTIDFDDVSHPKLLQLQYALSAWFDFLVEEDARQNLDGNQVRATDEISPLSNPA
jgi:hypothetical protein